MTGNEIDKYLLPALRNLYGDEAGEVEASTLLKLTGHKHFLEFRTWYRDIGPGINRHMDDHLRSILTALAGPHGRTLLKVLEINKQKRRR